MKAMFQGYDRLKKILFNLTFYPLFLLLTAGMFGIFFLPVVILRLLAGARLTMVVLRWLIWGYGFMIIRVLIFPFVRIEYQDDEGPRREPCVFVCNHRSASDAFLMALLKREMVQVVNNWPFKIPILGWVAERAGYLSIQSMPFEDFFTRANHLLKQGVSIAAFPEGSRSTELELRQFNGAVFLTAQAARVPVVPVCISGNEVIPEKGTHIFNPGTIRVHKLTALEWESFKDILPFQFKNKVREILQAEFNRMQTL